MPDPFDRESIRRSGDIPEADGVALKLLIIACGSIPSDDEKVTTVGREAISGYKKPYRSLRLDVL
jgi:hypothetical protein